MTKNIPTPNPMKIFNIQGLIEEDNKSPKTVKSGSAIVIIKPSKKEIITMKNIDCFLVMLEPIYWPTLVIDISLPKENIAIPKIKKIRHIKKVISMLTEMVSEGIKKEYCNPKITITIKEIGTTLMAASNNFCQASLSIILL